MISMVLGIYLAIDLFLLGLGLVQMLRQESRAPQVLAITLLWPWMVFRAILRSGLRIVRELGTIANKTLREMRSMILEH
jgi:hypothetical protein